MITTFSSFGLLVPEKILLQFFHGHGVTSRTLLDNLGSGWNEFDLPQGETKRPFCQ
jgi:hypothetical protein